MIEAVLWDNDGVLVDTERIFFEVTRAAFASAGAQLEPEHWARSFLGLGLRSRQLAAELGLPESVTEPMLEERDRTYRKRLEGDIPVREGVREVLHQLRGRVRLAMVTGSPRDQVQTMHRHTGLLDQFEFIIAADDCRHSKPNPEAYLLALNRLGLPGRRCLAVEDSPRGLKSALAAGVPCLVIPHELTDLSSCAGALAIARDARHVLSLVPGDPPKTRPGRQ